MKLLMITQKIDADDDILGVYHEWAREISKSFEKLSVICLYKGRVDLPEYINVFSLGKEKHADSRGWEREFMRIKYALSFYKGIWAMRKEYDGVFVHMNPIYIILGFIPWRIMRKKIFLWYAHPAQNILVRLAHILSDKIVTSVPEAFYARSKKVSAIGQGINTELFSPALAVGGGRRSLLYLGRISPAKRIDILLDAIKILRREGACLSVSIVGDATDAYGGRAYYKKLLDFVNKNNLSNAVKFAQSVPNRETPAIYNRHDIFINLSPTGYFDKTVLEAMACECIVLASNEAYKNLFPQDFHEILLFKQNDAKDLAKKIEQITHLSEFQKESIDKRLRLIVERNHSIFTLGKRIKNAFESCVQ